MSNTSTCHFNNIHMFGYILISKQVTQLHMHCFHHSSDLVDPIQESSPFLLNKMLSRVIVLSLPVILSFTHTHTHTALIRLSITGWPRPQLTVVVSSLAAPPGLRLRRSRPPPAVVCQQPSLLNWFPHLEYL